MSTVKTNKVEGLADPDYVELPTGAMNPEQFKKETVQGQERLLLRQPRAFAWWSGNTAVTTISASNTPVKAERSGAFGFIEKGLELFSGDEPQRRLIYEGQITRLFSIDFSGEVRVDGIPTGGAPTGNANSVRVHIFKNGATDPDFLLRGDSAIATEDESSTCSIHGFIELAQNDYLEIFIENRSNTDDLILRSMNLRVY